jgi:hypothetical protein
MRKLATLALLAALVLAAASTLPAAYPDAR